MRIIGAGNPKAGCGSISTAWKMLGHPGLWRYRLSLWVITILLKMIAAENKFWGLCMMDQSSTQ